jgi:hypothetical protein
MEPCLSGHQRARVSCADPTNPLEKPPESATNRAAEAELDVSSGQLIEDVAGIRQRAGEPIQFCHHEGVARWTGSERQPKTWPVPVRASQAVVDVDAIVPDAERVQPLALGGEILLLC